MSHRTGHPALSYARKTPCRISKFNSRSLVPMLVRSAFMNPCPADMSGHAPDTIPDIEIAFFERKTGSGRPDILSGHGFKVFIHNDLSAFFGFLGYPHVRTWGCGQIGARGLTLAGVLSQGVVSALQPMQADDAIGRGWSYNRRSPVNATPRLQPDSQPHSPSLIRLRFKGWKP